MTSEQKPNLERGRQPDSGYASMFLARLQARPDFSETYPDGINPKYYSPPIQRAYEELFRAGQNIDANTIFSRVNIHFLEERGQLKSRGIDTSRVDMNIAYFSDLHKFALGNQEKPNKST